MRRLLRRRVCAECGLTYGGLLQPGSLDPARGSQCGGPLVRRHDDHAEIIRERLQLFEETALPLVEHYRRHGPFASVDGSEPPSRVTKDLLATISSARGHARQVDSERTVQ